MIRSYRVSNPAYTEYASYQHKLIEQPLTKVREQLDRMNRRRLSHPYTPAEREEYNSLLTRESELLGSLQSPQGT